MTKNDIITNSRFDVLIADDDFEDRELLKLEIQRALGPDASDTRFSEASSVRQAVNLLASHSFDLLTLDIEFDRMTEGIDALPEIFETHPSLNIIVISGKLDKWAVAERLLSFTRDNVLKGKRWVRHFDMLDKKDDKTGALRRAHAFALHQREGASRLRGLFLQAEAYLEKNMIEKCLEVYHEIQRLAPGDTESVENIAIVGGGLSAEFARKYFRAGETIVGAILMGHLIDNRLQSFTRSFLGRVFPSLSEALEEMEQSGRISRHRRTSFRNLLGLRTKALHHPASVTESDLEAAAKQLKILEKAAETPVPN